MKFKNQNADEIIADQARIEHTGINDNITKNNKQDEA